MHRSLASRLLQSIDERIAKRIAPRGRQQAGDKNSPIKEFLEGNKEFRFIPAASAYEINGDSQKDAVKKLKEVLEEIKKIANIQFYSESGRITVSSSKDFKAAMTDGVKVYGIVRYADNVSIRCKEIKGIPDIMKKVTNLDVNPSSIIKEIIKKNSLSYNSISRIYQISGNGENECIEKVKNLIREFLNTRQVKIYSPDGRMNIKTGVDFSLALKDEVSSFTLVKYKGINTANLKESSSIPNSYSHVAG